MLKYVILENGALIMFSLNICHDQFKSFGKIRSAGFYQAMNIEGIASGISMSLNIESQPEDTEIIRKVMEG